MSSRVATSEMRQGKSRRRKRSHADTHETVPVTRLPRPLKAFSRSSTLPDATQISLILLRQSLFTTSNVHLQSLYGRVPLQPRD